jgi:glycosyltransferase involved in cell wall biosynthesis
VNIGLYLADLRRSSTDSHGIINHALGLARSLPVRLRESESLFIFAGEEIRGELPTSFPPNVQMHSVPSPAGTGSRLMMDHVLAARWARDNHLDVMHFPKGHIPLLPLRHTATVATIHDDIPLRYVAGDFGGQTNPAKMRYFAWATKRSLRSARLIITVSEFSRKRLESYVSEAGERIAVIPNGITLPQLDATPIDLKSPLLVHLGSRFRHKRSFEAITWLRPFLEKHPEFSLVVTGSLNADAEGAASHRQIRRIRTVLSNYELADLIRKARALVFPSALEGFGLPPVEAVVLGTPPVWARSSALQEVMNGAPGGFTTDDPESFSRAIDEVMTITDADLKQLATRFSALYSWETVASRTLELYRSLRPS